MKLMEQAVGSSSTSKLSAYACPVQGCSGEGTCGNGIPTPFALKLV